MIETQQMHELCCLRSALETFAVQRWRKSSTRAETEKQMRQMMEQLSVLAKKGDCLEFRRVDNQLHRTLIVSVGLPPLLTSWEAVIEGLSKWNADVITVYWPNLMALYQEHVLLLEAWNSEDDWVAEEATRQHMELGLYRIAYAQGREYPEIGPVERAKVFISAHFASRLEMEWVARHVAFLSMRHFDRLFRDSEGIAPYQYLKQTRLNYAARILRSGSESVAEVSTRAGYNNTSHFVRDFRKQFGVTPLVYRRQSTD